LYEWQVIRWKIKKKVFFEIEYGYFILLDINKSVSINEDVLNKQEKIMAIKDDFVKEEMVEEEKDEDEGKSDEEILKEFGDFRSKIGTVNNIRNINEMNDKQSNGPGKDTLPRYELPTAPLEPKKQDEIKEPSRLVHYSENVIKYKMKCESREEAANTESNDSKSVMLEENIFNQLMEIGKNDIPEVTLFTKDEDNSTHENPKTLFRAHKLFYYAERLLVDCLGRKSP
jgi:hypothetical protein